MKKLLFSVLALVCVNGFVIAEITPVESISVELKDVPPVKLTASSLKEVNQNHCNGNEEEKELCAKVLELIEKETKKIDDSILPVITKQGEMPEENLEPVINEENKEEEEIQDFIDKILEEENSEEIKTEQK